MKRFLFALALFALVLPGARKADAAEVSIDFFYDNLSGGSWIEAGDYGYCWQPEVAVTNANWRPYADGYWAYTDVGWTWVSYEDFGWATYHYGRWARLRDHGWVWVPGYEWGPAWVSWRTGGDYVGWAPLPPRRYGYGGGEVVYEGRSIGTSVDIEFDIGPMYYNFVDVRYIGAPVLREHIYAPSQNITYIQRTVNVTNIRYDNATVYNYGPDYNRLSAYSTRPIQRLTLQRDTNADFTMATRSGALTKVQGDRLVVAAPPRMQRPAQPVAPKVVKTKVEKPDVETGWMGVTDPNAKAQLQEKIKKEDPKSVPPPQIPPKNPEALNAATAGSAPQASPAGAAAAQPDAATPPAAAAPSDRKGRGKDKRVDAAPAEADGAPAHGTEAGAAPAAQDQRGKGKNKDRRGRDAEQPPSAAQEAPAAPESGAIPPAPQDERRGKGKRGGQSEQSAPATAPGSQPPTAAAPDAAPAAAGAPDNNREPKEKKNRGREQAVPAPALDRPAELQAPGRESTAPAVGPADDGERGRGRGKQKRERMDAAPQPAPAADTAPPEAPRREAPPREERRRERKGPAPDAAAPQEPAGGPAAAPQPRGKPERGKKKDKEEDKPKKP